MGENEFFIEIAGYRFYPAFLLLLALIPILVFLSVFLIRKFRIIKEKRQVYSTSKITTFEKKYIPQLLDYEIKDAEDDGDNDYAASIEDIKDFVIKCTYWNNDELLAINQDSILILTSILFDDIKANYTRNPDRAVLLLHSIDNINGGMDFSENSDWMPEDMPAIENSDKMEKNEARALELAKTSLNRAVQNYLNDDTDEIPITSNAFESLRGVSGSRLVAALEDIITTDSFYNLKDDTYEILSGSLIDQIDQLISEETNDYFDEYYLAYFRLLASLIDRQTYNEILKTIED